MPKINQVLPADNWFAVFKRERPGAPTSERSWAHHYEPLAAWALVTSTVPSSSGATDDRLRGIVLASDGRETQLVNENAPDFVRYLHGSDVMEIRAGAR